MISCGQYCEPKLINVFRNSIGTPKPRQRSRVAMETLLSFAQGDSTLRAGWLPVKRFSELNVFLATSILVFFYNKNN